MSDNKMTIKFHLTVITVLVLFYLISCNDASFDFSESTFSLVNSQTSSSGRLDILYDESYSGNVSYIVSSTDLKIYSQADYDKCTAVKTPVAIKADDQIYDDYIAIKGLASGKQYFVYILNTDTGALEVYTQTTKPAAVSVQETGTITGYSGNITYRINFPAGYDTDTSKTWPFVISFKAPNFTAGDPNFPCITFNTDTDNESNDQVIYDIDAVGAKVKSIIEDSAYRIDRSRIYACGFSLGGCAVMRIANNMNSIQYKVKAIAANGVSGWIGSRADWTGNLGNTDIWLSCGENDPYGAQTAHTNMPKISGDHLLSVYPGVGHDSSPTWASPYTFMWMLSK